MRVYIGLGYNVYLYTTACVETEGRFEEAYK